jgi:hypothetical protein
MGALQTLGFILGSSFASGLNLYATVAALGLLHRFEIIRLPGSLDLLAHPVVVGIAVALYVIEFVADKVPYFDSVWDVVHTFIRPPAAGVLAYAAMGDVPEVWKLSAALLAGTIALGSHGTKASTRAAINASPEPFSNWVLSVVEDGLAIALVTLAVTHPILTLVIVLVLVTICIYLLYKLFSFVRRLFRRAFRRPPAQPQQA